MNIISSAQLRHLFLDFFQQKGHHIVPSSPLVPSDDATLLFTNAGMVQFKEHFLGHSSQPYQRAVSTQRCLRAGGKHNDLDNVGYTARHHTFFEMLGNFSFGDYFKQEAIHYAWEFLTVTIGLPKEKLWITVYDEDDEAAQIWLNDIGISPQQLSRIGAKDNFWSMGDTGPCGPCSEIFYDHGPAVAGGPPGSAEEDGDRYIEIWNLVFMQYDRKADGTLAPLPRPSVDTGMGLERLAAILQGVHNNYDIDLFKNLISAIASITGEKDLQHTSLRVIADHIRACAFMITDGVLPANEGRGYVLRRIIRRAIRHGHQLGMHQPFFHQLVQPLINEMGAAFPELVQSQTQVEQILQQEESRFAITLDKGLTLLEQAITNLSGNCIDGDTVFLLYDTYGFPVDLTADIARERQLTLDMAGFDNAMANQKKRARSAHRFQHSAAPSLTIQEHTFFCGYTDLQSNSLIQHILIEGKPTEKLTTTETAILIIDKSPFYAESGGQVGDTGAITTAHGHFIVNNTQKQGDSYLHYGQLSHGHLSVGESVQTQVNQQQRINTAANHSATHLLHAALRQLLGEHITQKGSLVDAKRLRFDFSHPQAVTESELQQLEQQINQHIRFNHEVSTALMPIEQAKTLGAMALFGEKYADEVRVLSIGDVSIELCGGTHVERAGDIGLFKIISESGTAAGIRRIEAVTGEVAMQYIVTQQQQLQQLGVLIKCQPDNIVEKTQQLLQQQRQLEKELATLKRQMASQASNNITDHVINVSGLNVLAIELPGVESKELRATVDKLKDRLSPAVIILATIKEDKVTLIAGVSKNSTSLIKAGELVNYVAQQIGGKGGGRPDMAQGGGTQPDNLTQALDAVPNWIKMQMDTDTSLCH